MWSMRHKGETFKKLQVPQGDLNGEQHNNKIQRKWRSNMDTCSFARAKMQVDRAIKVGLHSFE